MFNQLRKAQGGFTLVEVSIILFVLVILSSILLVNLGNYNRLARPAVVFVRDGDARLVVRRETLDDLVRLDVT